MKLFPADMRQRLRNPSIKMVSGIFLFLIAVVAGIPGATVITNVIKNGIQDYSEMRADTAGSAI